MKTGIDLIAAERTRQIEVEGYTPSKDMVYNYSRDLSTAAACYAVHDDEDKQDVFVIKERGRLTLNESFYRCGDDPMPFPPSYDKRDKHSRLRRLVIAGALIAAEIDKYLATHPDEVTA